jgi:antitoxin VapB
MVEPLEKNGRIFMQLNIKNDQAHALAVRLARATGESLTTAVTRALEQRLARVETPEEKTARWMIIAEDSALRWKEPFKTTDHGDLLYDELGLPK